MNELNNHAANWSVDFIPWYQSNDNGLYYYNGIRTADGMPPTVAQVSANSSFSIQTVDDASTVSLTNKVDDVTVSDEFYAKMATNMFEAHREFIGELSQAALLSSSQIIPTRDGLPLAQLMQVLAGCYHT